MENLSSIAYKIMNGKGNPRRNSNGSYMVCCPAHNDKILVWR